ncbi:hypothetical protein ES692_01720 [Psychroserpens burtonensis]|uniref:Uncharacterized protein n=1 Tax=Psychroserpens burtonensis TaxID=49278 RepID=A0A5C7BCJ8_9FLAO|nr:hypothetical protein [Psychroserpens burtonensis]TXE20003.1 hypothetical protein ES692_01720 [Psychroserpens burtonensis]
MKTTTKTTLILLFLLVLFFTSCRSEETEFIETPPEDLIQNNSVVASLIQRTAANDGSNDNILDFANCFNIKLPINVKANSIPVNINSTNDYYLVESIFDEDYDDTDVVEITFPITIVNSDFSEVIINDLEELTARANSCNGENISDDDIECIDFIYPFSASKFNLDNELLSSETFTNDYELYSFIEGINTNDITSINFPISVLIANGESLQINSLTELETTIENEQNTCDEDDDFDYNDDDCDHCTQELVINLLTGCQNWYVDKTRQNSFNYDAIYDGYDFNFYIDGTVSAFWNSTSATGTWSTTGTANNILVLINIPALQYCNNNWRLQEINTSSLTKIDLRIGDEDRLRYRNTCD